MPKKQVIQVNLAAANPRADSVRHRTRQDDFGNRGDISRQCSDGADASDQT